MLGGLSLAREALQEAILFFTWPPGRFKKAAQPSFLTALILGYLSSSSSLSWISHAAVLTSFYSVLIWKSVEGAQHLNSDRHCPLPCQQAGQALHRV